MRSLLLILIFTCFSCKNKTEIIRLEPTQTDVSSTTQTERMKTVSEGNKSPNATRIYVNDPTVETTSLIGLEKLYFRK